MRTPSRAERVRYASTWAGFSVHIPSAVWRRQIFCVTASLNRANRASTARPGHSLLAGRHRPNALVDEFLQALSFVRLGRVKVALGIGGDAVHAEELTG